MIKKDLKFPSHQKIIILAFAVLLGLGIYSFVRLFMLGNTISTLSARIVELENSHATSSKQIRQLNEDLVENFLKQSQSIAIIEQKMGIYKQEVSSVSSLVTNLEKLSKTDPQLLAKYSKVFFLSENYAPERVYEIPADYKFSQNKAVSIHRQVWPFLQRLIDDARKDGIHLYVSSGYRSFAEQKALKSDHAITYGVGTANQFSADQGYSEHQLGTTVDFLTTGINGDLDRFGGTQAHQWLLNNAHRYGFILSYPENNQYYVYEPWHWRFVGVKLAQYLKEEGKRFYDMDQREIDKYLVSVFE